MGHLRVIAHQAVSFCRTVLRGKQGNPCLVHTYKRCVWVWCALQHCVNWVYAEYMLVLQHGGLSGTHDENLKYGVALGSGCSMQALAGR